MTTLDSSPVLPARTQDMKELIPAQAGLRSVWPDMRVLAKRATWLIATLNRQRQRQPGRGSPYNSQNGGWIRGRVFAISPAMA
jgi:hypothetical protein